MVCEGVAIFCNFLSFAAAPTFFTKESPPLFAKRVDVSSDKEVRMIKKIANSNYFGK
jgi:hypothetical protein